MQLMLDNLPPDTTQEDLLALLAELGIPTPTALSIAPGLRDRPSAAIDFDLEHADMEAMVKLLNGHAWKTHILHATHTTLFR